MIKFFARFFIRFGRALGGDKEIIFQSKSPQDVAQESVSDTEEATQVVETGAEKQPKKSRKKKENAERQRASSDDGAIDCILKDIRDITELMEVPIVALSKNRTAPIIYESPDGKSKVTISCHPPHYVASIYDWDIILFVSSKLQETMNNGLDVPPRTLIIPRHEFIKAISKHAGKTTNKEIEASLTRLKSTLIETTIHNEDHRYRGGFGFLDRWGYTERKDVKEFRITLSDWLYEITCCKGALLKVDQGYFKITSGLKRFLYRTARKHVGIKNKSWIFSVETLYERSGSEREFKKFKHDLKMAVADNDIPDYFTEWVKEDGKEKVRFINKIALAKVGPAKSSSPTLIKMNEIRHLSPRNLLN
jgi:plasmid replication initiation protein